MIEIVDASDCEKVAVDTIGAVLVEPLTEIHNTMKSTGGVVQIATPPVQHNDDPCDSNDKDVVREMCKKLLVKLDEIQASVLHLQYSLHAGDIAEAAVERSDRAQQLWAWDKGGLFSAEVSSGIIIQGVLDNVFNAGFPDTTDGIVKTESEADTDEESEKTPEEAEIGAADLSTAELFAADSPDGGPTTSDRDDTDAGFHDTDAITPDHLDVTDLAPSGV